METIEQTVPAKKTKKIAPPENKSYENNILVPFELLVLSPDNVGKTGREDVDELAALIYSQGLLSALIVKEQIVEGVLTGKYEVVAGGRRWRALKLLVKQNRKNKKDLIECKQVDADNATEASIAENSGRLDIHPADQFEAFKKLIDSGKSIAQIATRFGVAELTIERRLRLANVSPVIFAQFRLAEISLDQMMALAVTDDHSLQEVVWNNAQQWDRQPHILRRKLMESELDAESHPLAKFVGVPAYEQAGGIVRRDLFSEEGKGGFIVDVALLRKLANDKLTEIAARVATEKWLWVEVCETFSYQDKAVFGKTHATPRDATEAEQAELTELEGKVDELSAKLEMFEEAEDCGDEFDATEAAIDAINERMQMIEDQLLDWSDEVKTHSGAMVTIDHTGGLEIHRGLIKAESKAAAQESLGVSVDQIYKAPNKPKQEFSEKLMLKLTSHRTAAMQVAMLNNHHVALVAVTHTLLCQEFRDYTDPYDLSSVKVSGTSSRHHISSKADDMEQSRAWAELEAKRAALKARLPDSLNEYFGWLLALETPELLEILAFLTANCLDVTSGDSTEHPSTDLFAALDVNMADWWTPTVGSYLSNVPKVKVIEAVSESIGAMATAGMEKMKKDELLACAERKLEGRGWLPGPLRS